MHEKHSLLLTVSPGKEAGGEGGDLELGGSTLELDDSKGIIIDLDGQDDDDDEEQWDREAERLFGEDSEDEGMPAREADGSGPGEAPADGGGGPGEAAAGDERAHGEHEVPRVPAGAQRQRRYAVQNRRRKFKVPREPTQQERDDHMLTHQPPEDWCEYCARGKALCTPHRKIREEDRVGGVPTVSVDLGFVRRRGEDGVLPMVVVRENLRGETRAHGLRSKHVDATQGSWLIKSVVSDIECTGFKNIVLKSDQEPVMRALQLQIKKRWAGEVIPRYSAVGMSASNGVVEKQYKRSKHNFARCSWRWR